MRRFIGPNWPRYRDVWLAMKGAPALVPTGSYAAATFTSLWLLYRKRYGLALGVMALQILTTFASLDFGGLIDLGVAALLGIYGKSIVVRAGIVAVARIKGAAGATDDEAYSRIVRAGGTNLVAPIAGTLIAGLIIAGAIAAAWPFLAASGAASRDSAGLLDALRALRDATTHDH